MDTTELVIGDLDDGQRLIEALEEHGLLVDVAAWLLDGDSGTWRLYLSSEAIEKLGTRSTDELIGETLQQLGIKHFDLDDVVILNPRASIISDLRRLVRTGDEPQRLRLHDLELGGRLFRSSRIYRARSRNPDGWLEVDALVRVRSNDRKGVVRGVQSLKGDRRYFVLYELTADDMDPEQQAPPRTTGEYFTEQDLDFLYAVRPGGWAEKPPIMAARR